MRQLDPACAMKPPCSDGIKPGADERRFAAARRADDAQEARVPQAPEEIVDLLLSAEEQMVFVGLEAAKAGKRIEPVCAGHHNALTPVSTG